MDFLNPVNPTRVTLIKALLRCDKNAQKYCRLTFSTNVGASTSWLPRQIKKDILAELSGGSVDDVGFDFELDHVNAHFSPLADMKPDQSMPDITVGGFEIRKTEDGLALRFSFEVGFGADIAAWLAKNYGTDVYLRCDNAQPSLPGVGESAASTTTKPKGPVTKTRTATMPPKPKAKPAEKQKAAKK